jgi:hypothetical protein
VKADEIGRYRFRRLQGLAGVGMERRVKRDFGRQERPLPMIGQGTDVARDVVVEREEGPALAMEQKDVAIGAKREEGRKPKADPMAKRNPGIPGPSTCHKPFG